MEHFLQSREWEEFQKSINRETWRVDGLLITKLPLIFNKAYLYAGGLPNEDLRFKIYHLRDELNTLARNTNAIFFKFEPMIEDKKIANDLLGVGFRKSRKSLQPQKSIVLDITKSEKELLAGMHSKTRYNIRLAEKHNLKFSILNFQFSNHFQNSNFQKFVDFWTILQKTAERDAFHAHTKEYYQKLLETSLTKLFGVEHDGKLIAASIVLFYGDRAYYLHGASDHSFRNLMAPYLLHWETIKYAKSRGFKEYDLWGINETKWPGVTRFKRGFGGREIEYVGSYDYVFQPFWYKLYELQGDLRRKAR